MFFASDDFLRDVEEEFQRLSNQMSHSKGIGDQVNFGRALKMIQDLEYSAKIAHRLIECALYDFQTRQQYFIGIPDKRAEVGLMLISRYYVMDVPYIQKSYVFNALLLK